MAAAYQLTTPLAADKLLFAKLNLREKLGEPYRLELHLLSRDANIDFDDLLGQSITLTMSAEGFERHFHGIVSSASHAGQIREYEHFVVIARPRFWFLRQGADCRIFQNETVVAIVKKVLAEAGVEIKSALTEDYPPVEYCVQYRESNFDFVSRLLEAEGIYYYFTHAAGQNEMVLVDASSAHKAIVGVSELQWMKTGAETRDLEYLTTFRPTSAVTSGTVSLTDYNFETPKTSLQVRAQELATYQMDQGEVYDYWGKHATTDDGQRYANTRIEELLAGAKMCQGEGNALGLATGGLFKLIQFPRSSDKLEYLVIDSDIQVEAIASTERLQDRFRARFHAIPSTVTYRPPRKTPRPVVNGPHTAVVVGKAGEEILTDKYGRIRVQFHWDRLGAKDEKSSCWLRVAQSLAGALWGSIFLPRIGQEVIVQFLEGDPDRPLVTGSLYNADMMPPYTLPANMTQSGIKTRSTKNGTDENFNELRFEDLKDQEEIYLHAERDFNRVVENNDTLKVGFDKKDAGDQTVDIYNHRTVTLDQGNDKLQIKTGNRTVLIDKGNLVLTITEGTRTEKVKGNDELTVESGNQVTTVSAGNKNVTVSQGNLTVQVSAGKCSIEAAQEISLTVGSSKIVITTSGITIQSGEVKIQGDMGVAVDGGLSFEAKGTTATLEGEATTTIKGGIVAIN